jgi:short-subunit dehydrogenase
MAAPPLVWITGASSGIGQALAEAYLAQGWRVALVARRLACMQQWLAQRPATQQTQVALWAADVRDAAALNAAAQACMAQWGLPDVVIANAGVSIGMDSAHAADLDVMRELLEVNTLGVAATFQPFVAQMQQRRSGTLVGVASMAAIRGLPGHGAYCASKAGVVAYCESLRGECRAFGVNVVTLLPGYVATPLTAGNRYAMPFLMSPQDFAQRALRAIARGEAYRIIPWQMAWVARIMRCLPAGIFDRLAAGRGRKQRRVAEG